jgi:hypothetical protein
LVLLFFLFQVHVSEVPLTIVAHVLSVLFACIGADQICTEQ